MSIESVMSSNHAALEEEYPHLLAVIWARESSLHSFFTRSRFHPKKPLATPHLFSFILRLPHFNHIFISSVQFSAQLCPTLWDSMDCSTPGFPVYHQFLELAQTHVHWVSDAIQPSHPLSSPSPPAFNLSQHQGLFQWVSSLDQMAKVLELQLQHQSFQWIFRIDWYMATGKTIALTKWTFVG